jgi:hypothetical protein
MTIKVEEKLYWVSSEGLIEYSQGQVRNLSKDVYNLNRIQKISLNSFSQYLPDLKQLWFYFNQRQCLVYDLHRGIFMEYSFSRGLGRGFFDRENKFVSYVNETDLEASSLCKYGSPDYPSSEEMDVYLETKLYLNRRKLKKIETLSKFSYFIVRYRNSRLYRDNVASYGDYLETAKLYYDPKGIYIFPSGIKGDFKFCFYGVEKLDFIYLYYR